MQKRVLSVNDISCVGRCSLTVALPVISAGGIECSVLPTAVLSTHTGGFSGFTYRDLTADILPVCEHWRTLGIEFDALYTGYLGSFEQLNMVSSVIDMFKREDNLVLVDPVMADNGSYYSLITPEFTVGMASLCRKADIITPNLTEAAFLTGVPYAGGVQTLEYVETILCKLYDLSSATVVLTGICFEKGKIGAAVFDGGQSSYYFSNEVSGDYPGSGDVFASALLTALLNGKSIGKSAEIAVDFTVGSIRRTKDAGSDTRYGLDFENGLPAFIQRLR